MLHNKFAKEPDNAMSASVRNEMAKPRVAKSAKIAELNLDTARTPELPSALRTAGSHNVDMLSHATHFGLAEQTFG